MERREFLQYCSVFLLNFIFFSDFPSPQQTLKLENILEKIDYRGGINLEFKINTDLKLYNLFPLPIDSKKAKLSIDKDKCELDLDLSISPVKIKKYREEGVNILLEKIDHAERFYIYTNDGWKFPYTGFTSKYNDVFTEINKHLYFPSGKFSVFLAGKDHVIDYGLEDIDGKKLISADIKKLKIGTLENLKIFCASKDDYLIPYHVELRGILEKFKFLKFNYFVNFDLTY